MLVCESRVSSRSPKILDSRFRRKTPNFIRISSLFNFRAPQFSQKKQGGKHGTSQSRIGDRASHHSIESEPSWRKTASVRGARARLAADSLEMPACADSSKLFYTSHCSPAMPMRRSKFHCVAGPCSKILRPSSGFSLSTGFSYGSLAGVLRLSDKSLKIYLRKSAIAVKSGSALRGPMHAWVFSELLMLPIRKWFFVWNPPGIACAATCWCR